MKTIRTIIATLSAVLLTFALVAWFSVRRNAAFIQRTIYQGFDQTFVVALVMGCAFLLIAIILTVAILSTDEDDEDEEDEEPVRPKKRPQAQSAAQRRQEERRSAAQPGDQPYRRVTRTRTMDQKPAKGEDNSFARPKGKAEADRPASQKQIPVAESPDKIAIRRQDAPVNKEKPAPAPVIEPEPETVEQVLTPVMEVETVQAVAEAALEPATEPDAAVSDAPEQAPEEAAQPEEVSEEAIQPEEVSDASEEAPEPEPESEPGSEPEAKPRREEGTVRCIFCGSVMSRDSQVCPNCGKKR